MKLEKPECKYEYTEEQVNRILGPRADDFHKWARGQTRAICDGREYDYLLKIYKLSCCGPHGLITYKCDLEQFLGGGRPLD